VLKRAFDISCATILLLISVPVLLAAALLIKFDSEGPVIFRQDRMGRGFQRFRLLKLRTMNLHGIGSAYTLGADPRITRIGRWLRRFKIDELPQLWNVLRGEMSIVGPRPVIPELALEFKRAYEKLLSVRPGLTDPASLKYCNETEILESVPDANRYFKTVITPDKLRISLAYLLRANLWSDLALIVRTALAIVSPALRRRYAQPVPVGGDALPRAALVEKNSESEKMQPLFKNVPVARQFEFPLPAMRRSVLTHERRGRDSLPV
jgi:lipopolysaccharide/colanic/teichoic acid biosynthesis glycosyltransferase